MGSGRARDGPRIDRPVLESIRNRLRASSEFDAVAIETDPYTRFLAEYDRAYYPATVEEVFFDVRWYTNDDFAVHYHEGWTDEQWDRRWDRHPNGHNTREHYHPPPHGHLPARDATYPGNYWDVIRLAWGETRDRIAALW